MTYGLLIIRVEVDEGQNLGDRLMETHRWLSYQEGIYGREAAVALAIESLAEQIWVEQLEQPIYRGNELS